MTTKKARIFGWIALFLLLETWLERLLPWDWKFSGSAVYFYKNAVQSGLSVLLAVIAGANSSWRWYVLALLAFVYGLLSVLSVAR